MESLKTFNKYSIENITSGFLHYLQIIISVDVKNICFQNATMEQQGFMVVF